jgi:hypothetical protein
MPFDAVHAAAAEADTVLAGVSVGAVGNGAQVSSAG